MAMDKSEVLQLVEMTWAELKFENNSPVFTFYDDQLVRFANRVADAQREKDAQICAWLLHHAATADECADAIRATKEVT